MIEFVCFMLLTILWPVILIISLILAAIGLVLPYIVAMAGAAVVLVFIGAAICGLLTGSIRQRLKVLAWIVGFCALFAMPYFVHNRGWDAAAALGVLLVAFTYNQVREL